jgi:hypothetical protein
MESLLEGEAEQLTRKVIELAKAGDLNALRLCLERLIPPRKDRTIHLVLPPIENVQQICLAMARVAAAVGEGEITPTEGEVLSNILVAHKTVLMTGDLGRRMDELEQRMAKKEGETAAPSYASGVRVSNLPATAGGTTNLANRLNRLERLLGPPPPPISRQVADRALATAFSIEELTSFEDRLQASGATSLVGIFAEGTTEHQEVLRRLEPALDKIAQEMAGKSFADLLREEAGVNAW